MRKPIPRAQRQAQAERQAGPAVSRWMTGVEENRHLLTTAKELKLLASLEAAVAVVESTGNEYDLMKMSVSPTASGTARLTAKADAHTAALAKYNKLRSEVHQVFMSKLSK